MGKMSHRGKGAICYSIGEGSPSFLDRDSYLPAEDKHQGHRMAGHSYTCWNHFLHGTRQSSSDEETANARQNAWAADYDEDHFKQSDKFIPERYLDSQEGSGTPHYGYGAGSRMCAGSHLANRELYTAFIRLITAFRMQPPENHEDEAILNALDCNAIPTSLTTEPKPFKVGFKARNPEKLKQWIEESENRTRDL
jgi:hypothetical protein